MTIQLSATDSALPIRALVRGLGSVLTWQSGSGFGLWAQGRVGGCHRQTGVVYCTGFCPPCSLRTPNWGPGQGKAFVELQPEGRGTGRVGNKQEERKRGEGLEGVP